MTTSRPNGLFLGAGASCELGMPLVHEFTGELRSALRRIDLPSANKSWRKRGVGFAEAVVDDLLGVLSQEGVTYENALGYLQIQYSRKGGHGVGQDYAGLFAWLCDLVYYLLYQRHLLNLNCIHEGIRRFDGIRAIAKDTTLWIFSLNHDLLIEFMAQEWTISLKTGFSTDLHEIRVTNEGGTPIGTLPVHRIMTDKLDSEPLNFLNRGENGINLFKLHGSLDTFMANDAKQMLKLSYTGHGGAVVLKQLRMVNEQLAFKGPPKATNHIMYFDEDGELQFLRKALIIGVQKYQKHLLLEIPKRLLQLCRHYLNHVSHLAVVGYSFGDIHVNQILQDWLEFSQDRRITIVDPVRRGIPQFLGHLASQVSVEDEAASRYFGRFSTCQPTRLETMSNALVDSIRRHRSENLAREKL